jgi:hypothetical protein
MELKLVRSKYGIRVLAREFGTRFYGGLKYEKSRNISTPSFYKPFLTYAKKLLKCYEFRKESLCILCT